MPDLCTVRLAGRPDVPCRIVRETKRAVWVVPHVEDRLVPDSAAVRRHKVRHGFRRLTAAGGRLHLPGRLVLTPGEAAERVRRGLK